MYRSFGDADEREKWRGESFCIAQEYVGSFGSNYDNLGETLREGSGDNKTISLMFGQSMARQCDIWCFFEFDANNGYAKQFNCVEMIVLYVVDGYQRTISIQMEKWRIVEENNS